MDVNHIANNDKQEELIDINYENNNEVDENFKRTSEYFIA